MRIKKVLVVDDEKLLRMLLEEMLTRLGKEVVVAKNGQEAVDILQVEKFDAIFTDMKMGKTSGLQVLEEAKKKDPKALVIIATAFGTVEEAVTATKRGAFHYLIKPFSFDAIESILQKAEEHMFLVEENSYLRKEALLQKSSSDFIFESPAMKQIIKDIEKISKSSASVFITGESGTGKEKIAEKIHELSPRKGKPFVKVNCAAIPDTLLESEFFGHEKGAFTGALARREGRFELANKGSLLLDEVTEIPLSLQPKLLRAIQEQEFERVGSNKPTKVDIRFIATSNRNMEEAVNKNIFRKDLFYRLNVVPIHLPPLRERKEDIMALAIYFLEKYSLENNKKVKTFTKEAANALLEYQFPGNVRQLANMMERIVVLDRSDSITKRDLSLEPSTIKTSVKGRSLKEVEAKHILKTLEQQNHNKKKTAERLGITTRTLRNKLHELNKESER